jgi:MYXO-CTERM domain-containing protein
MYGAYGGGIDSITADDRAGICTLYPGTGATCPEVPCSAGFECVSGSCEPITGDGTLCSTCTDNSECGGPGDLCIRFPDGASYCTTACRSSSDCGENECFGTSAGGGQCAPADSVGNPTCAGVMTGPECTSNSDCDSTERCNSAGECVPRPVDLGGLGDPCETGDGCNSGECITTGEGSICTETCNWLDPASCAAGYYCDGEALGTCGEGRCMPGSAGAAGLGDACTVDSDCDSLFCVGGTCGLPCVPGGVESCPDGFSCIMGSLPLPSCGVCQQAGMVGDWCERNQDCASFQCAERGDINFCTAICNDASECPESFTCDDAGGVSVCAPPPDYVPPTTMTPTSRDRGGCGCDVPGQGRSLPIPGWALLFGLPALIWVRRRK